MKPLSRTSRYTLRKQLPAEVLWQVFQGLAVTQFDIVARKGLGIPMWLVTFIYSAPPLSMLLSVYWGASMAGRSRGIYLAIAALLGPAVLLTMPWIRSPEGFVLCVMLAASATSILVPFRNRLLQTNYAVEVRGRAWGQIASYAQFAYIGSAVLGGWLLDRFADAWRTLFPVGGLVGLLSILLYSRIRLRGAGRLPSHVPRPPWWRDVAQVFKGEPRFLAFQAALMIYGFGIHLLIPINLILVNDILKLSYQDAAWMRQFLPHLAIALLFPLAGRLQDRANPARMGLWACSIFCFYPLFMAWAAARADVRAAWAGFAVFGVAMTLLQVLWELGPAWFAGKKDASLFMGIHAGLVGVRGMAAPPLGAAMGLAIGFTKAYVVGAGLFAAGAWMFRRLARRIEGSRK